MRFVSELGHDAAGEYTGAWVPFEINRPMCSFAVNFRPTMRTTGTLVFGGNQVKAPKLGIVHDLFSQRSASSRNDLNHRLHLRLDQQEMTSFAMLVENESACAALYRGLATANLRGPSET